jgi:hypothetical protein
MRMSCTEPNHIGWYHAYLHPWRKGDPRGYGSTELSAIEELLAIIDELEAADEQRYLTETGQL